MSAKKQKPYNDYELCKDIAQSELTTAQIAEKYHLSERMVAAIASGGKRPELKQMIDQMVDATMGETNRILRTRSRWSAARLLQLAKDDRNPQVALKATVKSLELAGAGVAAGAENGVQSSFASTSLVSDDVLTMDIDQIGSTIEGGDMTVILEVQER